MRIGAAVIAVVLCGSAASGRAEGERADPIDRRALVLRHNVVLTAYDGNTPVSVGNGEFAFNLDITGLQTFAPFNTMSQWGWHEGALPAGKALSDYRPTLVETHGRMVPYPLPDPREPELSHWLASSPHRINLGRVGLAITKKDGSPAREADLMHPRQELDLWRGLVTSTFEIEGVEVKVETACHPTLDAVAARIESPLISQHRLSVFLACPGNNPLGFANFVGDWSNPATLEPLASTGPNRADFRRVMDEHVTYISLAWGGNAELQHAAKEIPSLTITRAEYGAQDCWVDVTAKVRGAVRDGRVSLQAGNEMAGSDPAPKVRKALKVTYAVGGVQQETTVDEGAGLLIDAAPDRGRILVGGTSGATPSPDEFSIVCTFSPVPISAELPDAAETLKAAQEHWERYWTTGGAIDLSESSDPRWRELERRIVLSQYLMAVHEAGSLPPQESGLVNNGWFGRFHMEMYWWHAAHWALWNHWDELDLNSDIYTKLLPGSRALAESQGYKGARWPKCVGNNLREWPHEIHAFLIWQQPHPIFFAELEYRARPTRQTLEKWREVVEATADFMATYAHEDPEPKRYVLGPPIHLVSENSPTMTTQNPAFELGYWRFGLRTAQQWRARLGLAAREDWAKVLKGLSPLPVQDGVYVLHEDVRDMWTTWNFEHPALIGTLGVLPGDGVDAPTMVRTLRKVSQTWNFGRAWGWDYPMLAMCAARTGDPAAAMDFLLTSQPGFQFDSRGLATGGPFPYFPSNGGLLYAAAMMAAGWDGAPDRPAPGFPADGTWTVRYEGLSRAP